MVIDPNNSININNAGNARSKATSTNGKSHDGAGQQSASDAPDSVVLSQQAQQLNRLAADIDVAPEIDAAKVAQIKKAIAEGSFEINTDRIAEKMLKQDGLLDQ